MALTSPATKAQPISKPQYRYRHESLRYSNPLPLIYRELSTLSSNRAAILTRAVVDNFLSAEVKQYFLGKAFQRQMIPHRMQGPNKLSQAARRLPKP